MKTTSSKEKTRDWKHYREMWIRVLERKTGERLAQWNARIKKQKFADARSLEAWLARQGVTGYGAQLLVMERFGYPDFVAASAEELIEAQYADRANLRPIYEAIIGATRKLGDFVIQARKGYVSLVAPRRTFARVQATTKKRVDLGLRLEDEKPGRRLRASRLHETMKLQLGLTTPKELDREALGWLKKAYDQNS